MKRLFSLFLLVNIVLFSFISDGFSEFCYRGERRPSCEDLGFKQTMANCEGHPYVPCPFNSIYGESKAYCNVGCEDENFPLDDCDEKIGTCVQCAVNGKWRYEEDSCEDGYVWDTGKCIVEDCRCEDNPEKIACRIGKQITGAPNSCNFIEGKLDTQKSDRIGNCMRGDANNILYRYEGCKEGWRYENCDCVPNVCPEGHLLVDVIWDENQGKYDVICPEGAECRELCFEGVVAKSKITCDASLGLRLQMPGDITGETYKCREHQIGNIAFYCKDASKISNLGENLDIDGDQIISLEKERYDEAKAQGCEAIGVVFYNDDADGDGNFDYKIVGLKNIGYDTSSGKFYEQTASSNVGVAWSSCWSGAECDLEFDNTNDGNIAVQTYPDGEENTNIIIKWVNSFLDENGKPKIGEDGKPVTAHKAPAAQATRVYYPRLGATIICPEASACGKGKWYLPSGLELYNLFKRHGSVEKRVQLTLKELNKIGLGFVMTSYHTWSSNEASLTQAMQTNGPNMVGPYAKGTGFHVRPILNLNRKPTAE